MPMTWRGCGALEEPSIAMLSASKASFAIVIGARKIYMYVCDGIYMYPWVSRCISGVPGQPLGRGLCEVVGRACGWWLVVDAERVALA